MAISSLMSNALWRGSFGGDSGWGTFKLRFLLFLISCAAFGRGRGGAAALGLGWGDAAVLGQGRGGVLREKERTGLWLAIPVIFMRVMFCNHTTMMTIRIAELKLCTVNCFHGGVNFKVKFSFTIIATTMHTIKNHCFFICFSKYIGIRPRRNSLEQACLSPQLRQWLLHLMRWWLPWFTDYNSSWPNSNWQTNFKLKGF